MMKKSNPGRQPTKLEQLVILNSGIIKKRSDYETIVVHHISKDEPHFLQLEIERRCPMKGIAFERLVIAS